MAILTDQKRSPLFDRKKRNEEEAQIVVNPFTENLYLLTSWTWPCLLIHYFGPWLNPSDKEKHHSPLSWVSLQAKSKTRDLY